MIGLLCLVLSLFAAPHVACAGPASPATLAVADEKVVKALEAWLKLYRDGKIAWNNKGIARKDSVADKFGQLPKDFVGELTRERELEVLLERAAADGSAEAMAMALEVASIGLDDGKYTRDMAPFLVRALGEKWTPKFATPAAAERLVQTARGEAKAPKGRVQGLRAAALRALGRSAEPQKRALLEAGLAAAEPVVRMAAADGLAAAADEAAVTALAGCVERETDDKVLEALVSALRASLAKYAAAPAGGAEPPAPPESSRLAIRAAIGALGRTSWRADLALVGFLEDYRSTETVPALVAVLQKFKDNPQDVLSGKTSGLLLHRSHDVLVSLTGAVFPADRPDQWRELWEKEKATMKVSFVRPAKAGDEITVAGGFCGIPVQGTRVVFVLDLSGSMTATMPVKATNASEIPDKLPTRLDFAKRELLRALDQLGEVSAFNLVTFNGDAKARQWQKDLQVATAKNKDAFRKYVADLKAEGGTNLWGGLQEGLKIKSLVYGERYESNVDELFVLSDGAPTVGEVLDPLEILRLIAETNRFSRVRINTVFISTPGERLPDTMTIKPEELMRRMAEANGGKFVEL
jgi:hypothetical protein